MSWQNNWGTVKSTNAKACALYFEVANVGKTIESSKKRVIWRVKVEDGREFEIILTHSLASGKKILRIDGIVKYTSKSLSFGDWDHVFNLPGGYTVHIIIKPSVELNDMYDLIIDGTSFRRLPDRLDPNRAKNTPSSSGVASSTPTRGNSSSQRIGNGYSGGGVNGVNGGGSRTSPYTYNYSNGGHSSGPSSRESSFSPWPCSRCTLVNEKPLAPICEACGAPKPDYISPEERQRAKEAVQHRPSVSATRSPSTTSPPAGSQRNGGSGHSKKAPDADFFSNLAPVRDNDSGFSPFSADPFAAGALSSSNASVFGRQQSATTTSKPTTDEISSMLSGLDFTAAPVQPVPAPPSQEQSAFEATGDGAESTRTADGDLWASSMVDLNLKPVPKQKPVSAKSYQTLEQARMQAPKDKVPVLPPPAPVPVAAAGYYGTNMAAAPGGFYQQPQMYNTTSGAGAGGYAMAPTGFANPSVHNNAMVTYGGNFGGTPQQQQQQQFRPGFPPASAGANTFGSDPFATLS